MLALVASTTVAACGSPSPVEQLQAGNTQRSKIHVDEDLPTSAQREKIDLDANRTDVALQLAEHRDDTGIAIIATVSVASPIGPTDGLAFAPKIELQLPDGVSLRTTDLPRRTRMAGHPPACVPESTIVTCWTIEDADFERPEPLTIPLAFAPSVPDRVEIKATASSLNNPVSNDPNPEDNAAVIEVHTR